jgi:hypothetical protein
MQVSSPFNRQQTVVQSKISDFGFAVICNAGFVRFQILCAGILKVKIGIPPPGVSSDEGNTNQL